MSDQTQASPRTTISRRRFLAALGTVTPIGLTALGRTAASAEAGQRAHRRQRRRSPDVRSRPDVRPAAAPHRADDLQRARLRGPPGQRQAGADRVVGAAQRSHLSPEAAPEREVPRRHPVRRRRRQVPLRSPPRPQGQVHPRRRALDRRIDERRRCAYRQGRHEAAVLAVPGGALRLVRLRRLADGGPEVGRRLRAAPGRDRTVQARRVRQGSAHGRRAESGLLGSGTPAPGPDHVPPHPGRQHAPDGAAHRRRPHRGGHAAPGRRAPAHDARGRALGQERLPLRVLPLRVGQEPVRLEQEAAPGGELRHQPGGHPARRLLRRGRGRVPALLPRDPLPRPGLPALPARPPAREAAAAGSRRPIAHQVRDRRDRGSR